jgi:tetratricopeptide (TPR) repeat protein
MGEWLLLCVVLGAVALAIAWPLLGAGGGVAVPDPVAPDRETLAARHRLALEGLRDVEADRRAGSLDDEAYATQRREAEEQAAATRRALDAAPVAPERIQQRASGGSLRAASAVASVLVVALLAGFALPGPMGIGERTQTNQALADAREREQARQAEISGLLDRLAVAPRDTDVLSALADAYLAGGARSDLQHAAAALLLLINYDPGDESAYRRLITAYISAGDWTDASATLDAYTEVADAANPDLPFFAGLIALRGEGDAAEAVRQFDRFLELAPDDPRATMIRGLRAQALGELEASPEGSPAS